MRPLDTSPEVWDRVVRHWQTTSGPEKVESARRLGRSALDLMRSGIRARHPHYSDEDVRLAVMRRILGDELFQAVFPDSPDIEP